jgi:hypothetical protein
MQAATEGVGHQLWRGCFNELGDLTDLASTRSRPCERQLVLPKDWQHMDLEQAMLSSM